MTQDQINLQQVQLLARKALLNDELKTIDAQLGQLAAINQFIASQPKPEAPAE